MAQRVQISLTDDLLNDETLADETLVFAIDGTSYEIDLSSENAATLRDRLAPYVAAGRKVTAVRRGGGRKGSARANNGVSANEIRDWARRQGLQVSDRGRVRDEVKEAYAAAHR
ncbi:MAG: Lsr2 family protein [Propioniciclava sp.]